MKPRKANSIIMKFGGTSVGSAESIQQIIKIVSTSKEPVAGIIVSAFSKVTNLLTEGAELASKGDVAYEKIFVSIAQRHFETINNLILDKTIQSETTTQVELVLSELESILKGIFLIKELSVKTLDTVLSYGERLSAYIITQGFKNNGITAEFVDTRNLIKTDTNYNNAKVNFKITNKNIKSFFAKSKSQVHVITGFIASTENNETTTLGRGGSDYSASIIGAALAVKKIEIWTDVDGVLTADPRKVPAAFTVPYLSYKEAMEMSHFGAKVIYPPTMTPARMNNIPLIIKNTFNPKFSGTIVSAKTNKNHIVKGITSIEKISVLLFQGSGIQGIPGMAKRLFSCLSDQKISIILIIQASSEHTICFAIDPKFVMAAKQAINEEFRHEMHDGLIDPLTIEENLSIIAIVGDHMKKTVGTAGKLFTTLFKAKINITAIAQGSSEMNISVVISSNDETKALRTIHDTFFKEQ